MPPLRRYLRITQYSVLEVRIYLDNPTLQSSWLLHPTRPMLPRIMTSIQPLVLPKLREENERSNPKNKSKGSKKKKGVKDVVVEDDFEVSIFLTDGGSRHALLKRQKYFKEKEPLRSNSSKLLGGSGEKVGEAIEIQDENPVLRVEDDEDGGLGLQDIPAAPVDDSDDSYPEAIGAGTKRRRRQDSDSLFVDDEEGIPSPKRSRLSSEDLETGGDDKKKMAMDTTYDGFSIYGKVLCLVVKKKDIRGKAKDMTAGRAMMEEWITATQMPEGLDGG